jgi:anti-sigma factor RsiW
MKWPFTKCRRLEADVSLLAAGTLAGEERAEVEAHLAKCDACRTKLAELRELTGELELLGKRLPQVEPTVALRRRWQTAVRQSARPETQSASTSLFVRLLGRRAAWGSLAAIWVLVLFFRFSAPDAPRPVVVATAPISLREVWLALKVEDREPKHRADASDPSLKKKSHPDALPPRSQLSPVRPADSEVV